MPSSQPTPPQGQAAPAKPAHQIEQEKKIELLRKVRQTRQNAHLNHQRVWAKEGELPADKKYVWVNKNESRVVYYQGLGYAICRDERVMTNWRREDGTHQYADLILMDIDRGLWEAMKLDSELRGLEGVEGEDMFKAFAERAGIPVSTLTN